jgi:hypothetical protein
MTTIALSQPDRLEPSAAECVGRVLTVAGLCFGGANLVQWGVLSGALPLHPAVLALSWPAATAGFLITLFRIRKHAGPAGRRVAGWSRLGVFTLIGSALALLALSATMGDWGLMAWNSVVSPLIYAVAWSIAAVRGGRPTMALPALVALGGAVAVAMTIGTPNQYLACAVTLAFAAVLPGLILARGPRL